MFLSSRNHLMLRFGRFFDSPASSLEKAEFIVLGRLHRTNIMGSLKTAQKLQTKKYWPSNSHAISEAKDLCRICPFRAPRWGKINSSSNLLQLHSLDFFKLENWGAESFGTFLLDERLSTLVYKNLGAITGQHWDVISALVFFFEDRAEKKREKHVKC